MSEDDAKTCKGCSESKPLSEFHMHPSTADRREGKCKDCRRIERVTREGHKARKERVRKERAKHTPHGMPQCDTCHEMKPIRSFPRSASANWAYGPTCKACCIAQFVSHGKQCTICRDIKPLAMFYKQPNAFDGFTSECRACIRVSRRASYLNRRYGLSQEEYEKQHTAQGGLCAICGNAGQSFVAKPGPGRTTRRQWSVSLFVDHNHTTGEVRGLLCNDCNSMLGYARDNADILQTAVEYLALYRAKTEAS